VKGVVVVANKVLIWAIEMFAVQSKSYNLQEF
jgi:hypothetical protein